MPKPARTAIATARVALLPRPTPSTTFAAPTIVTQKVRVRPATTPIGRRRPPAAEADSTAGSTGSTHGLIAVPAPATNANASRSAISAAPHVRIATLGVSVPRAHGV